MDRFIADVVFFYKVINDHIRLTLGSRVRFSRDVDREYELRSMDTSNVLTCYSSTNLFKYSFLNRVIWEWNCFPHDIRMATSTSILNSPHTSVLGNGLVEGHTYVSHVK